MNCTNQAHPSAEPDGCWPPGLGREPVTHSGLKTSASKTTASNEKKGSGTNWLRTKTYPCARSTEAKYNAEPGGNTLPPGFRREKCFLLTGILNYHS